MMLKQPTYFFLLGSAKFKILTPLPPHNLMEILVRLEVSVCLVEQAQRHSGSGVLLNSCDTEGQNFRYCAFS